MTRVSYTTVDGMPHHYEVPAHVTMDGPFVWRYLCGHTETGEVPCLLAGIQNLKAAAKRMCPKCWQAGLLPQGELLPPEP